jgi:hypothetical protein
VEKLLPNGFLNFLSNFGILIIFEKFKGFYLEIFGRRNNLRKNWVTVGNEI